MKPKRIVSLFLTVVLLLSLAIPLQAASSGLSNFKKQTEYTGFSDVPETAWYAESVKTVSEYGLMNGKTVSTFSPSGNMTIAEAIAIGCRLHDIYSGGSGSFKQSSPWYQVYADFWATFASFPHYFSGKESLFWTSNVTREIFAFIMDEALPEEAYKNINHIAPGILPDIDLCSDHWGSIYTLYNAGVLTGTNDKGYDGVYFPDKTITRAEASTILSRIIIPELRQKDVLDLPTINLFLADGSREASSSTTVTVGQITWVCACVSEAAQSGQVKWSSENPEIAKVEADTAPGDLPNFKMAKIYGISPGTVLIYAENSLGDQLLFDVEVLPDKNSQSNSNGVKSSKADSSCVNNEDNTTSATTPSANCSYIINTNTGKFHYTWCTSVSKMSEKNKWYYTGTRDSIVAMGYDPCKNCNP